MIDEQSNDDAVFFCDLGYDFKLIIVPIVVILTIIARKEGLHQNGSDPIRDSKKAIGYRFELASRKCLA